MSHTVAVGEFEGPLGALLELVEHRKFEVSAISVGAITSDYITYIRNLPQNSAEDLSEFIELGARLLYIKSLALLPQENNDEQTLELARLSHDLIEYRRFKSAATTLSDLATNRTWTKPVAPRPDMSQLPLPNIKLEQLGAAFASALAYAKPAPREISTTTHLSLESVVRRLRSRLPASFELQTILVECRDRLEIIVTFLALLELIRSGVARVTQMSQFQPILVESSHAQA